MNETLERLKGLKVPESVIARVSELMIAHPDHFGPGIEYHLNRKSKLLEMRGGDDKNPIKVTFVFSITRAVCTIAVSYISEEHMAYASSALDAFIAAICEGNTRRVCVPLYANKHGSIAFFSKRGWTISEPISMSIVLSDEDGTRSSEPADFVYACKDIPLSSKALSIAKYRN